MLSVTLAAGGTVANEAGPRRRLAQTQRFNSLLGGDYG